MKNVQIKATELTERRFIELFEKSDTTTKGEFLTKLLAAYEKPPVCNDAELEKIKSLTQEVEEKTAKITEQENLIQQFDEQFKVVQKAVEEMELPKGAIVLNFDPEFRRYFWGVNQMCVKMDYSKNYEGMIKRVFEVCYKRGELVLSKEDCAYLDTIPYDIEPEEGTDGK